MRRHGASCTEEAGAAVGGGERKGGADAPVGLG